MEVFIIIAWLSNGEPFPVTAYPSSSECWSVVEKRQDTINGVELLECRAATLNAPIAAPPVAPTSDMRPRKNPNF